MFSCNCAFFFVPLHRLMQINELAEVLALHPEVDSLAKELNKKRNQHFLLTDLRASAQAIILTALHQKLANKNAAQPMIIVLDDNDAAQYMYADIKTLMGEKDVYIFPCSHRKRQKTDEALTVQRTEVLSALLTMRSLEDASLQDGSKTAYSLKARPIIVTTPEALAETVPNPQVLEKNKITLSVGEEIPISMLTNMLLNLDFKRVDFVYEPGQFAVRGGIVDVYSFAHDIPVRIDFFGDEVDSIREFELETQLSQNKVDSVDIVGGQSEEKDSTTIWAYLPQETLWISNDFGLMKFKMTSTITDIDVDTIVNHIGQSSTLELNQKSFFNNHEIVSFDTLPQPTFNKNFDLLIHDLQQHINEGYKIYILADQVKQTDRLKAIFEDKESGIQFVAIDHTLHEGFIDRSAKICCYTDHQIFERYHRVSLRSENARRGKAIITLKEINQLQVGDYVVHVDHGIGQFAGLVTTNFHGRPQETIKLTYKGGDTIFVSIHNLHRISKYKGREGSEPTISRLGSGAWERMKERTKDKVKDIARDLIQLYAKRKQQQGFAYTPDGYMQHELEASFLYEDTPDQAKATLDIKHDMESPMPMDRLVCGDVGFGKTEVAVRAAFKAACDSKQVAVLVPTTVLAYQHYQTFKGRLKDLPVRVDYLSRARGAKQTKEVLKDLEEGKIDILIGTHKLIGKSVKFKDLGLLIIDEEQKFGVSTKEKLRQMKNNVDTLTMSATPIPRTLQFSLVGARDLSIIQTPPPNRYPIQTEIHTFTSEIIVDAINFEMSRNGQVYFVNNRIKDLTRIAEIINKYIPDARVAIGHGQMKPEQLEQIIMDFANHDYDVLLSTTIVENGIDIPNANTIIINGAHNFGLSDLHQMRGRVGRGNRKAFCYLLAPPLAALNPESRRRLEALENFSDLGSGINIAMQDLDIRGAGNLLGSEQSGFIADLGYETYLKILNEAVVELRNEQTSPNLSKGEESAVHKQKLITPSSEGQGGGSYYVTECTIDSDIEMYFPPTYVPSDSERMLLYRELDGLKSNDEVERYRTRMRDRFGKIPPVAEELMRVVPLRQLGKSLGCEKIILKQGRMALFLVSNPNSPYYQSLAFDKLLNFITRNPRRCNLREQKGKRSIVVADVKTVEEAIGVLMRI